MADQGLQAAPIPGRRHHHVGFDARTVAQQDTGTVETLDGRDRLDPPGADGVDQPDVLHRERTVEHPRVQPGGRTGQPERPQVGDTDAGDVRRPPVHQEDEAEIERRDHSFVYRFMVGTIRK